MKYIRFVGISIFVVLISSCVDHYSNFGSDIRPSSDDIALGTDTFHLSTETFKVDSIYTPLYEERDSLLLGTYYSSKFGWMHADILAQFNRVTGTTGFSFPANATPDSARIVIYYKSCFGNFYSPLDLVAYEMNKNTFDFKKTYYSNVKVSDFCDQSIYMGHRPFSTKSGVSTALDTGSVSIKIIRKSDPTQDFVYRMFNGTAYFKESDSFLNFFKGIYITTRFGASAVLNIAPRIDVEYYYHVISKNLVTGENTTDKYVIFFTSNTEVRQVNRYEHTLGIAMKDKKDSVEHIVSPANLYTRVQIPVKRINETIDKKLILSKKHLLNKAILRVEATDKDDSIPMVKYLMLIKESAIKKYFYSRTTPSDTSTCAIIAPLSYTVNSTTSDTTYYYNFDLARILTNEIKLNPNKESMSMLLIPVSPTISSSTGSYTEVRQQYKISATTIRSGKNPRSPMRLNIIYSGY